MNLCARCKYYGNCGDDERKEPCKGFSPITEGQAKEFYRDLKGMLYHGDTKHCDTGIMYAFGLANWFGVSENRALGISNAICHYGISETQGGGLVV